MNGGDWPAAIRRLAPDAGVKGLAALRAERDEAKRLMQLRHREMLAADDLMRKHQRRAETAEADRDRLAAANAALEAQVARLVGALNEIDALDPEHLIDGCSQAALRGLVLRMGEIARAALAEVQADARREGGE